jgi:hypothetical protein
MSMTESYLFAVEAHRFVAEVVEVDWFLACLAGLRYLALDR